MASSAWQNQPLPGSWEAKFDPGSGRYFFINHELKETTWVDPRLPKGSSNSGGTSAPPIQTVQLPPATAYGSPQAAAVVQQQQADFNVKVAELASLFPDAPVDVIRNLMYRCNCNPTLVKQALASHGYQPTTSSGPPSSGPPRPETSAQRAAASQRAAESANRSAVRSPSTSAIQSGYQPATAIKRPDVAAAPVPDRQAARDADLVVVKQRVVPEYEKDAARAKLVAEFKNSTPTLINMALDASEFDLGKTRILLRSMMDDDQSEERRRKRREEEQRKDNERQEKERKEREKRNQSALVRADRAATIAAGPGPVFIAETGSDRSSSIHEDGSIAQASNIAVAGSILSENSSATIYKEVTRATGVIHEEGAISKAGAIHRESAIAKATSIAHSPAHGMRTSICQGNGRGRTDDYISANRTAARGPDAALTQGPDKGLLIRNYIAVNGPDPKNRRGPVGSTRSLYNSIAVGADSSLTSGGTAALGPDPGLRNGPNPALREGSIKA